MSFGRKGRYNRGSYRGRGSSEREMHKVTCADCGKETEVPFKPDGSRPVYCRECYAKRKGTSGGKERYNRGSYSGREKRARPERTNPMIMDLIEEIRADVKAIKEKVGA
jgi:CxxC-x17-CxxC domain-containing protein